MIIGRKEEKAELLSAYESEYSEFVAITGRRRIGKTFLVRETFDYRFAFQHSGIAKKNTRVQLKEFRASLVRCGMGKCRIPKDWFDAFHLLENLLDSKPDGKKVVFIDELPWMDAKNSTLVSALEHFWNSYASARKDILLIICGSATSWIVNKVFKNHGGLYNRVSHAIRLYEFTLNECEQYAKERNLGMSRYEIMRMYMAIGGVPFYWSLVSKGLSATQNIDRLLFNPEGRLHGEYDELYASLFDNPAPYMDVISCLGKKGGGFTRKEISKMTSIPNNSRLTVILEDLTSCGFIREYKLHGARRQKSLYQLMDSFTLFYYRLMKDNSDVGEDFWMSMTKSSLRNAWEGLAFESLCFKHLRQIKKALGISGVATRTYSWRAEEDPVLGKGVQVDMVIDRADGVVNLCEMKFSSDRYTITKSDDESIRAKVSRFNSYAPNVKSIYVTMVTPWGLNRNIYWNNVQNEITADDLFAG